MEKLNLLIECEKRVESILNHVQENHDASEEVEEQLHDLMNWLDDMKPEYKEWHEYPRPEGSLMSFRKKDENGQ